MIFEESVGDFLHGRKFIGSLHVKISTAFGKPLNRTEFLTDLVKGKKVIHLGCVDHLPLVDSKIKSNTWLHKLLCERSERCLGIDINKEGIEYIKSIGFPDSIYHDMLSGEKAVSILENKWDYLILGEILEHVDNPVLFLSDIQKKYGTEIKHIVITVPNGLRFINFKNVIKHKEVINSDHRYWFTPYTLAKICTNAGLKVESFQFLLDYKMSKYSMITPLIYKLYPGFLDNLCMTASFENYRP